MSMDSKIALSLACLFSDLNTLVPEDVANDMYESFSYMDDDCAYVKPLSKSEKTVVDAASAEYDEVHFIPECRGFRINIH